MFDNDKLIRMSHFPKVRKQNCAERLPSKKNQALRKIYLDTKKKTTLRWTHNGVSTSEKPQLH